MDRGPDAGWRDHDPAVIGALYTDDAVREQRAYWETQSGKRPPSGGWGPIVAHAIRAEA